MKLREEKQPFGKQLIEIISRIGLENANQRNSDPNQPRPVQTPFRFHHPGRPCYPSTHDVTSALDCGGGVSRRANCNCITPSALATSAKRQYSRGGAMRRGAACGEQSHRSGRGGNATCDTMMRFDATGVEGSRDSAACR